MIDAIVIHENHLIWLHSQVTRSKLMLICQKNEKKKKKKRNTSDKINFVYNLVQSVTESNV